MLISKTIPIRQMRPNILAAGIVLAVVAAIACGSSDAPAAPAVTAVPVPTPTAQPTATAAPAATPTPAPTATPVPSTPTPEPVAAVRVPINDLPSKAFPVELDLDSEKLPKDQVADLWSEFVSDTRFANPTGEIEFETCGDGTGIMINDSTDIFDGTDSTFRWEMIKDPGGRWNVAILIIDPDNPDYISPALTDTVRFNMNRDSGGPLGVTDGCGSAS